MANPQERPVPISETSLLNREEYSTSGDEYVEPTALCCSFGCFRSFCTTRRRRDIDEQEERRESWGMKKLKRLKEITEVIAGPKWKNFIRSFSNKKIRRNLQYQYDLDSYALNFDEGFERSPDFSARFAAPLVKNGMESNHDSASVH